MKNTAPVTAHAIESTPRQHTMGGKFLPKALAATMAVTAGSALAACDNPNPPSVGEAADGITINNDATSLAQEATQATDGTTQFADAFADAMKADTTVNTADIMAATEVQISSDATFDSADTNTNGAEAISASDIGYIDPANEQCQTVTYEECPPYKNVISFKKTCAGKDANGNPIVFTDPTCIQADCKPAPKDGCPNGTVCDPDGDGSFKFSKCN